MNVIASLIVLTTLILHPNDREPRQFELNYDVVVSDIDPDATVRVWFPIAESNELQTIELLSRQNQKFNITRDKTHNNAIGYFQSSGQPNISFGITYGVVRKEAKPGMLQRALTENERRTYLAANKLVPTTGKPIQLIDGKPLSTDSMKLGEELYDIVHAYMTYDKSKPGYGNGDVLWACSSKTGNCTDFHSLFISLARNKNLPARFEIGFPIGKEMSGKIGGYHCWAWFYTAANGWIAVDISEADKHPELKSYYFGRLTPDRVAFSVGRDVELVPKSNAGPLNYFVYPHVEVNGKVWPQKKIKLELSYQDIKQSDNQ